MVVCNPALPHTVTDGAVCLDFSQLVKSQVFFFPRHSNLLL